MPHPRVAAASTLLDAAPGLPLHGYHPYPPLQARTRSLPA